jgi:hypothetical protein
MQQKTRRQDAKAGSIRTTALAAFIKRPQAGFQIGAREL